MAADDFQARSRVDLANTRGDGHLARTRSAFAPDVFAARTGKMPVATMSVKMRTVRAGCPSLRLAEIRPSEQVAALLALQLLYDLT